jgi:hypothetical protein
LELKQKILKLNQFGLQERLRARRVAGERISRLVRFSSSSREVQAVADRIWRCNSAENLWTGEDLHDVGTGELYDGRGGLWACNNRLCPACVSRLSKRNRKIMRFVMQNERLLVGTNWRFITLTLPDLNLLDLNLLAIRAVINSAWRIFSRSVWFKSKVFGGAKSEEFSLGNYSQIHFHLHLLAVAKWIDAGELRAEWTDALEKAFKKHNLNFEANTSDGFAVCHIERVTDNEKSVLEISKYITKSDSWAKIPAEQLAELAAVERMPRMFEVFGSCKITARILREKSLTEPKNAESEQPKNSESLNRNAYLDKKYITDRFSNSDSEQIGLQRESPPLKRVTWREMCRILPRDEWLKWLNTQIANCQTFRKQQLRSKFVYATFSFD